MKYKILQSSSVDSVVQNKNVFWEEMTEIEVFMPGIN